MAEKIPVVPLYFAKSRPVVERDGALVMVDDSRMKLLPGERAEERLLMVDRRRAVFCL